MSDYDLIVIGAGAAGLAAARAGVRAGRTAALVERELPGGECTNYGCVPSKTLLAGAGRTAVTRPGQPFPDAARLAADFTGVMTSVHDVITEIGAEESAPALKADGIEVLSGEACFLSPNTVAVDGRPVSAQRIVLATGAQALVPPIPGLADTPYLDNRSVFALAELPAHLVVLGGGAIGCELAQAFRQFTTGGNFRAAAVI